VKRPLGVWIIGIIGVIAAVINILGGITALGVGGLSMAGSLGETSGSITGKALGVGIALLIVGILYLIFALSFLGLRHWAWSAMMIIQWLTIIVAIFNFVFGGWNWSALTSIILPLIIVFYLTRPRIRQAFSR
jgi:hypothetical protein